MTELEKFNPIREVHTVIGQELLDRVKSILDSSPEILTYSVSKDWSVTELLTLKHGNQKLTITLTTSS